MTLKDTMNGSPALLWVIAILFTIISIILLMGRGANLIAGYNTSSNKEKQKYNTKKLCRVVGIGLLLIAVMVLVMAIFYETLPAWTAKVFGITTIADCIIVAILSNTVCKV